MTQNTTVNPNNYINSIYAHRLNKKIYKYKHASQLLLEFKQFDDIKSKFSDKKKLKH